MKRLISLVLIIAMMVLFLIFAGCESGTHDYIPDASGYDPAYELEQMRLLVLDQFPDIESYDDWKKTIIFRDQIHWVTRLSGEYLGLPLKAEWYADLLSGDRGAFCMGMSLYMAACLQAFDVPFRITQMWTGRIRDEGEFQGHEVGHCVIEVWFNGDWEMHDPTFNICWMLDGQILSTQEIKDAVDAGLVPLPSTNGCEAQEGRSIEQWEERSPFPYFDYLSDRIDYRWEAVFF